MNAIDDIRIRADVETVTDREAIEVLEWVREWVAECEWRETADLTVSERWAYWSAIDIPTLIRFADRHIDGGIAFVLADVRRMAG